MPIFILISPLGVRGKLEAVFERCWCELARDQRLPCSEPEGAGLAEGSGLALGGETGAGTNPPRPRALGVSFSGDIQDPPGQVPLQPAVGDPAWAGGWTG